METPPPGDAPLVPSLDLDEPLGLAFGSGGTLWVADKDDEEVLGLASTGKVYTFSLEKVAPAALKEKKK